MLCSGSICGVFEGAIFQSYFPGENIKYLNVFQV